MKLTDLAHYLLYVKIFFTFSVQLALDLTCATLNI
jgi:hypothetical protein